MSKELLEAVELFISQPLNNPLSRGQIMEVARIALPILDQQERGEGSWIEWGGGDCPVHPGKRVHVKFSSGDEDIGRAEFFVWSKGAQSYGVIAYRIIDTNQNGEQ